MSSFIFHVSELMLHVVHNKGICEMLENGMHSVTFMAQGKAGLGISIRR